MRCIIIEKSQNNRLLSDKSNRMKVYFTVILKYKSMNILWYIASSACMQEKSRPTRFCMARNNGRI